MDALMSLAHAADMGTAAGPMCRPRLVPAGVDGCQVSSGLQAVLLVFPWPVAGPHHLKGGVELQLLVKLRSTCVHACRTWVSADYQGSFQVSKEGLEHMQGITEGLTGSGVDMAGIQRQGAAAPVGAEHVLRAQRRAAGRRQPRVRGPHRAQHGRCATVPPVCSPPAACPGSEASIPCKAWLVRSAAGCGLGCRWRLGNCACERMRYHQSRHKAENGIKKMGR